MSEPLSFLPRTGRAVVLAAALAICLASGAACAGSSSTSVGALPAPPSTMTFSEKVFSDPRDIALGNAIEAGDLARIAELHARGASLRSIGRSNVTFAQVALHAKQHAAEVMQAVLDGSADPRVPIEGGEAVPYYAVLRDRADPAVVDVLLRHGISPDWRKPDGPAGPDWPLLFYAIMADNEAVVDLLIRRGANLHYVAPISGSALHIALTGGGPHFDIGVRLLDAGIDLSLRDQFPGRRATALETFCSSNRRVRREWNDETVAASRRFQAALARRGATLGCEFP